MDGEYSQTPETSIYRVRETKNPQSINNNNNNNNNNNTTTIYV